MTAFAARNLDTVQPLSLPISDPPTQAEVQALMDKINEVIAAGARWPVADANRTKAAPRRKRTGAARAGREGPQC